jgi:hypothetical protein
VTSPTARSILGLPAAEDPAQHTFHIPHLQTTTARTVLYYRLWRPSRLDHRGVPAPGHSNGANSAGQGSSCSHANIGQPVPGVRSHNHCLVQLVERSIDFSPLPLLPLAAQQSHECKPMGTSLRNCYALTAFAPVFLCCCGIFKSLGHVFPNPWVPILTARIRAESTSGTPAAV